MASLIGNSDAFTSWSSNIPETINAPTYDDTQPTPYIAPTPPPVITNVNTGTTTTLDSDFIDQIVRRNQENIYDSTKAQKIPLLTDEHDIAYAKQIDIDLLKTKTRYMVSDNENETHFTQNLKIDELLIRANGGDYKNLWDEIVNHSAHIYAGVQRDDGQDTLLGSHTTNIAELRDDVDNVIIPQIATNDASIATLDTGLSAVRDDIDSVVLPKVSIFDTDIDALKLLTSKMGFDNTTNPNDTWVGFNPDNIHLNTNTYVKSLFYKVDGTNWTNVSGYFQKVTNTETSLSTLIDDVDNTVYPAIANTDAIATANTTEINAIKNKTHTLDYDGSNWLDIHATNVHIYGNLYMGGTNQYVKRNGNWVLLDTHINNLADIKLAGYQTITYNGNQTTILNAINQQVANAQQNLTLATPYHNANNSPYNFYELKLPTNSLIFTGTEYRTRESDNQQTKLIPYLDSTGRLNSAHLWEEEIFGNQIYGATNHEKSPNQYVAGLVPSGATITGTRGDFYLNGEGVWSNGHTLEMRGRSAGHQAIIDAHETQIQAVTNAHAATYAELQGHIHGAFTYFAARLGDIQNDVANIDAGTGKALKDDMVIFGDDAAITASPVAIGYINEKGRLNTARLFDQIFNDQVFGVEDPDTTSSRRKSNAYLSGLVPTAENVADRTTKYLRADGTWSVVPIITDYLTTAEVDAKISAIPAPDLSNYYTKSATDNLISQFDTSAEVDAKINAIPADAKLADFDRNVYNSSTGDFMWDLTRLGYIGMPESHFNQNIFWKPTGQPLTNLNVMNDRVNTLITTTNALPDFDAITTSNKFCITNTANGGTISYITPTTSNFNEGSNLYYTDDRVATKITSALQGGEINNIITNQLQAQDFIANSDIRLKDKIIKIDEEDTCSLAVLEPVKYHFKNDDTKRTRYGFIAQDVEEVIPELVYTSDNGIKGINYQDIIALLVKDNQDLRQKLNKLEQSIKFLSIDKL